MAGAMSRMILTVMAAMAQLEREIMLERQREGMARAKAEGKYKGQPPHACAKAPQIIELTTAGRTRAEIAAALEISERSVYAFSPRSTPTPIERRATAGWTWPRHPCCRPPARAAFGQPLPPTARGQIGLYDGAGFLGLRARPHRSSSLGSPRAGRLFCI